MLKDFLDRLIELGHNRVQQIQTAHTPDATTYQMFVDGVRHQAPFVKPAMPPKKTHSFDTLVGLTSYLNSDHCKPAEGQKHIVFVGGEFLTANLSYSSNRVHAAYLEFFNAGEYESLKALVEGVSQKDLWRLLVTHLAGCFDESLLLAISELNLKASEESAATVAETGIVEGAASRSVTLTFPSRTTGDTETKKVIEVDWTYTGRYRECFDHEIVVPTRLEIVIERGSPKFFFHPIGIGAILRNYREVLADHLRTELNADRFTIHEGTEVVHEDPKFKYDGEPLPQEKGFTY